MSKIVVGPIIGKCTINSARILIEVDQDCKVVCTLREADSKGDQKDDDGHSVEMALSGGAPQVFAIAGLASGKKYRVSFEGPSNSAQRTGLVRTLDPGQDTFNVVAASCDKPSNVSGGVNMFRALYENFVKPGKVDLIVRHGDQVYADTAFNDGKEILKKKISEEEKDAEIREKYRVIYREVWNREWTARVYSECSHLMIWDDHEVRNDWGTFKQDKDPHSVDWRIAKQARYVYWEYQRQLWDDAWREERDTEHEGHIHTFCNGKFGVAFVDTRGPRSFGYDPKVDAGLYIGTKQMSQLQTALAAGGRLHDVKSLILVHSMPSVYMSTGASCCLACIPAMDDKMGLGQNPDEQGRYYSMLKTWTQGGGAAVVVGGDLHYAIRTTIHDENGDPFMRQMITSAINNKPPPFLAYCFLNLCCMWGCCDGMGGDMTFTHEEKYYDRNFGYFKCSISAGKGSIEERIVKHDEFQ